MRRELTRTVVNRSRIKKTHKINKILTFVIYVTREAPVQLLETR